MLVGVSCGAVLRHPCRCGGGIGIGGKRIRLGGVTRRPLRGRRRRRRRGRGGHGEACHRHTLPATHSPLWGAGGRPPQKSECRGGSRGDSFPAHEWDRMAPPLHHLHSDRPTGGMTTTTRGHGGAMAGGPLLRGREDRPQATATRDGARWRRGRRDGRAEALSSPPFPFFVIVVHRRHGSGGGVRMGRVGRMRSSQVAFSQRLSIWHSGNAVEWNRVWGRRRTILQRPSDRIRQRGGGGGQWGRPPRGRSGLLFLLNGARRCPPE